MMDTKKVYALLDMDSFYAQVESKRLGLAPDVPLGVQQHGHFIAVNYAARKRGVPSRCAVDKAKEICPEVVAAEVEMLADVKPSLERYRRASEAVLGVVFEVIPEACVERASIDEAYLDLTAACAQSTKDERIELMDYEKVISSHESINEEPDGERRLLMTASDVMNRVRELILERLGFTSSCGIAHNKLLAKVSASKNKPAGQTIVFRSGAQLLMASTGLRKIKGLGGKLGKRLEALFEDKRARHPNPIHSDNVLSAIQKAQISFHDLEKEFGTQTARFITSRAHGQDDSEVKARSKPKTLLSMKQFYQSLSFSQVDDWLRLESEELAKRAKLDHELFNRIPTTIVLHVYRNDGEKISRRAGFVPSDLTSIQALHEDIHRGSLALLRKANVDREGARGVGIGLDNFQELGATSMTSSSRITSFFQRAVEEPRPEAQGEESDHMDGFGSANERDDFSDEENEDDSEESDAVEEEELSDRFIAEQLEAGPTAQPAAVLARTLRPQTSREAGASEFVTKFFKASRLSFIGSWKRRFEDLLETLPDPPELPRSKFGERILLHVDLDAFFCSASLLRRPDLRDKPVAVCWSNATSQLTASSSSAEISSCNYIARARGVKAAMFLAKAKTLCPDLTCIPFDFELYETIGMDFYRLLFDISPHVEGVSCDEAYVDVTHLVKTKADIAHVVEHIRGEIVKRTGGVTASVGSGKNRLIARLCTAKAKPNNSFSACFFTDDEIFMELLNEHVEASQLPSIGWSTRKKLEKELNVVNVKEMRAIPLKRLKYLFGPRNGEKMYNLCRGVDDRPWNPRPVRDSVSVQISWGVRMQNQKEVHDFLLELSTECYRRLGTREGDTITVKLWRAVENQPEHMRKGQIGHGLCDILSRSRPRIVKGQDPSFERTVFETALELFGEFEVEPDSVRGVGVCVSGLATKSSAAKDLFRKRKIAGGPAAASKWIEGVGVVNSSKKYKLGDSPSKEITVPKEDLRIDGACEQVVRQGDEACRSVIRQELLVAFEESRCSSFPQCGSMRCDCFDSNRRAVNDCVELIESLINRGAKPHLIVFARWTAHLLWGVLPPEHPVTQFTSAGGGLTLLNEMLDDIETRIQASDLI